MATRFATCLLSTTRRHSLGLIPARFVRPQLSPRNGPTALRRSIHTALWPPLVFAQLLLVLWAYKCFMLIIFQNKLIYLPYIPLGARKEEIQDYRPQLLGYDWTTTEVRTRDGKKLSACVAEIRNKVDVPEAIIVYFQGNASSMPSRLPFLSRILKSLSENKQLRDTNICMVAPSYRGYWTSNGRPSQKGLEKDAIAVLEWIKTRHPGQKVDVILYGHSIGAGVASFAAASNSDPNLNIAGIILETPFTSVSDMLRTLYPQKWLPYRYLSPFLRSSWDITEYLSKISAKDEKPRVMIVEAENDEIVQSWMAPQIRDLASQNGMKVDYFTVKGALHFECMSYRGFPGWVSDFVAESLKSGKKMGADK